MISVCERCNIFKIDELTARYMLDKTDELEKENAALKAKLAELEKVIGENPPLSCPILDDLLLKYPHEAEVFDQLRYINSQLRYSAGGNREIRASIERKLAEREKDLLAVERNYNIQQETIERLKADLSKAHDNIARLMMENSGKPLPGELDSY